MNLAQLIAAVYTETNRPDLAAETLQSVLEATQSIHGIDNFYKDIYEARVIFDDPSLYIQTLDTFALPRFRKFAYIRKENTSVAPYNVLPRSTALLTEISVGDILDRYGYEKRDVWYAAGSQINIKSSTPLQYATIAWYQYPVLDATGVAFSSWVARENPYSIVYKAAGSIFAKVGEDKSYAMYMRQPTPRAGLDSGGMYYQQLAQLLRDNLTSTGV
jgi:hypothetical protein